LLEEGKRNIRERLERNGYFDAGVEYVTRTQEVTFSGGRKGSEELITYRVERGDRHTLLGIEFTGNHYFNTELFAQPPKHLSERLPDAGEIQPKVDGVRPGVN